MTASQIPLSDADIQMIRDRLRTTPDHQTRAPWEWRKIGGEWLLWGAHGHRPIVLDFGGEPRKKKMLRVREEPDCRMVPFYPEHPDAVTIAMTPELARIAAALLNEVERLRGILRIHEAQKILDSTA